VIRLARIGPPAPLLSAQPRALFTPGSISQTYLGRDVLAHATAAALGASTLHLFDTTIRIIPRTTYTPLLASAATRIGDPDDRATVALALAMGAGIWTLEHDFFGIGLPVWSTDVLLRHIATP